MNQEERPEGSRKRTRPLILRENKKKIRIGDFGDMAKRVLQSCESGRVPNRKDGTGYNLSDVPAPMTPVPPNRVSKAGSLLLGPKIGPSPVKSITQYLARRQKTNTFYQVKIYIAKDDDELETQDDRQGKMLMHTEYSLLSLLRDQEGVIHHHGLYKDFALEEMPNPNGSGYVYTGQVRKRFIMVLDCVTAHPYSEKCSEMINLQQFVTKMKKVPEREAIQIFYHIVKVVYQLHKRNIVHRDLKLGNIVLNRRTGRVVITNFCLGTLLGSDRDLLKDQRGSPAYISPDVLMCKPYQGKPSDMWALGVVLYTMLYGQFPFCDTSLTQLFSRIQAANYNIPPDGNSVQVSDSTVFLIQRLLVKDPKHRMMADEVLDQLSSILASYVIVPNPPEDLQVVPEIPIDELNKDKSASGSQNENVAGVEKKPSAEKPNERKYKSNDELGVFCVPLPDFLALNFPSPTRVQQNSILVHPTQTSIEPTPITSPTQTNQNRVAVQRIGRDARPLLPSEIARYQHMITSSQPQRADANQSRRDIQNTVPETRQERPETSRLRALAQRMPRLHTVASTSNDIRIIPWSERSRLQLDNSLDHDYVLRLPLIDLSRLPATRSASSAAEAQHNVRHNGFGNG